MGDISTLHVKQFTENIQFLAQQMGSKMRDKVRLETGIVGTHAFFDQIASTDAQRKTTRHADTPLIDSDLRRRRVTMYDYEWADLVDDEDKLKIINDPTSEYAVNAAWAMGRAMDDEIFDNSNAAAATGQEGGTSTSLSGVQLIAAAGVGMTMDKLRNARKVFDNNDIDPSEQEPQFLALKGDQIEDLLETTEATSADFNSVRALVAGTLPGFMGFEFVKSTRVNADSDSNRECIAWAKNGLLLAIAAEITVDVGPRRDKSMAIQVYVKMGIGSTRMEEKRVVVIDCAE